jgi:alkanesulfonate monooxygenase SsuD/methylene tetrahydromethanopterin reductase-like flavin-dependent oxidoreductase (luciferase family)
MPIMVGGNGPNVTWRLAARYADELNLDGFSPDEVRQALPTIRSRCEEIGRDPDSLAVSVHAWWGMPDWREAGSARQRLLADYAELGVTRVIGLVRASAESDDALESLAADARAAALELEPA